MRNWQVFKPGPFGLCLLCAFPQEDHLVPVYHNKLGFRAGGLASTLPNEIYVCPATKAAPLPRAIVKEKSR